MDERIFFLKKNTRNSFFERFSLKFWKRKIWGWFYKKRRRNLKGNYKDNEVNFLITRKKSSKKKKKNK